jgi:HD-like signal output (HDOD) protein
LEKGSLMHTILFVDDEAHIIDGLKRTLRSMRQEWRMLFASSGVEALHLMEQEPLDIIVTDMRMPGMNGAQLLSEVLKRYPHVVRIMLSGHSDLQAIMQSVGPTHQFLSKPCDVDLLTKTIANACALRDLLANPALRRIVAEMKSLPSLPPLYTEMMEAAQNLDAPIAAIAEVISRDAGMTAKILQLVNSAFFGLSRRISSAEEAINMLGLDMVRALVIAMQVDVQVDAATLPGFSADALRRHSLFVGKLAKQIARAEGGDQRQCEDAYTSGLLHDCGKLVLAMQMPEMYEKALEQSQREAVPMFECENAILGSNHAQVGAYLMGLWGLPAAIIEALAFHHQPQLCPAEGFRPLTAVYAANWLAHTMGSSTPVSSTAPLNHDYIESLHLMDRIETWQNLCRALLDGEEIQ